MSGAEQRVEIPCAERREHAFDGFSRVVDAILVA
jgi:hypothetical protein